MANQNIQQKLDANSVFIPECGCKIWMLSVRPNGYGQVFHGGKLHYAHRIAYSLANGEIPYGMNVLHSCDIPSCINPKHLRVGTQKDNVSDMISRDRKASSQGDLNGYARLNTNQVTAIKQRILDGDILRDIAKDYGVKQSSVRDIRLGRRWAHVLTERRDFALSGLEKP